MGVYAAGNPYGIEGDLIYSFPVQIKVSFIHSVDVLSSFAACLLKPSSAAGQDLEDCGRAPHQRLLPQEDGHHGGRAGGRAQHGPVPLTTPP